MVGTESLSSHTTLELLSSSVFEAQRRKPCGALPLLPLYVFVEWTGEGPEGQQIYTSTQWRTQEFFSRGGFNKFS